MILMSRLLICLSILLMFGCAKVYDCDKYKDSACTVPISILNERMETYIVQPGSSESEAQAMCMEDEYIFSVTIPAKVQSYLACGKPILAMVNGEGGKVVVDAKAGFSCAAESPHELVQNILKMKTLREKDISEMGENARKYYEDNFERSYLFDKAENIFRTMCESF